MSIERERPLRKDEDEKKDIIEGLTDEERRNDGCDMPEGQATKEQQIKRFLLNGVLDYLYDNVDDLLHALGVLLDKDASGGTMQDIVLFEDQEGRHHTIWDAAVIRPVLPGHLDDLLDALTPFDPWTHTEGCTPSGKGAGIKRILLDGGMFDAYQWDTADELLEAANGEINNNLAGDILFENGNGDYFAVTIEALMREADPDWVNDVIEDEARYAQRRKY